MRRIALAAGLLSACLVGTGDETRLWGQGDAKDYNDGVAASPAALRNGTATLEQVQEVLGVNDDTIHGEPVWELDEEADVDLDGVKDLVITNHTIEMVGGRYHSVFLKTAKGFRYVGGFEGEMRTLPVEKGKPARLIVSATTETEAMAVELAELQAGGLHRLARVEMKTAGCEAKDNPLYQELVCGDKAVSAETLKKAFPSLG